MQEDSSLEVTETIEIVSEGNRIRRGIYRDFPIRYRRPDGSQVRVGFDFHGATRNGRPEPAAVESLSNGVRIRIGSAGRLIDPGRHRYVIRYRTTRQIGRFADYDELYWNATGNSWEFPIETAQARIRLPSPVPLGQRDAYTGPQGSTDSNAKVTKEQPGEILFETTWPLAPYEGLTVAVAWPKGVVPEPHTQTRLGWWIADYGPPIVGGFGLLMVLAFYYVAWQRAGRDPRPGPMVPLFAPDALSPPAMRYVVEMNADNRAFASALVDMGVRGHVRIHEEGGGWLSSPTRKIERLEGSQPLPQEEQAALARLVSTGETIEMKQANHAKFSAARNALEKVLKKRFEGVMFHRNYGWAAAGVAVLIAALWMSASAVALSKGIFTLAEIGVPVGAVLTTVLLLLFVNKLGSVGNCLLVGGAVLFAFLGLALGLPLLFEALNSGWWLPFLLPVLSIPLVFSGFWWTSAPTAKGREVLDRIAGFKHYLSVAERERLDRLTSPEDTPELFERYLPYAIALGVENRWARRFAGVLAAAAAQGRQGFAWYSGSRSPWTDSGRFARSVGSSLASSVTSASSAPGSSSGSGGGGRSGGGGGGGGGGGW